MLETQKRFHYDKTNADKKLFNHKIDIIDKQIDEMFYELYKLIEEEIKIVEV